MTKTSIIQIQSQEEQKITTVKKTQTQQTHEKKNR